MFTKATNKASLTNRVAVQQSKRRAIWHNMQQTAKQAVQARQTFQPFAY